MAILDSQILEMSINRKRLPELRKVVNERSNIKRNIPFINTTNPLEFVEKYNILLKDFSDEFRNIFNIVPVGVGPGEILFSYLCPNLNINGGSSTYDIDLGTNKLEMKGIRIDSHGFAYHFRLGAENTILLNKAWEDIKKIYYAVKIFDKELSSEEVEKNLQRGNFGSSKINALRKYSKKDLENYGNISFNIMKNYDFIIDNKISGNLKDKDFKKNLKKYIDNNIKCVKTLEEINNELEKKLKSKPIPYFFVDTKKLNLYYKKRLSGAVIMDYYKTLNIKVPLL